MKLDNMSETITLTNPCNNHHYLLNLEQPVYADEETRTLINMIQLLAEENKYLRNRHRGRLNMNPIPCHSTQHAGPHWAVRKVEVI